LKCGCCRRSGPGCVRGRLSWAGPSRVALSSGRAGGQSGLGSRCACLQTGRFSGARDWGSNAFGSSLLLADNYNHTTNGPTTEAQSAQRTHRDFLAERSDAVLRLCDPCVLSAAAPGSAGPWLLPALGVRLRSWLPAWGPGRPGLRRYRLGGLASLGIRAREQHSAE
jgi:hypothetical protein